MANSILTLGMIAKEFAAQVKNNLVFLNSINDGYAAEWDKNPNGYSPGESISIKKPARFTVGTSATVSAQDFIELKSTLSVNLLRNVTVQFTTQQLTHSITEFSDRVIKPKAEHLASEMDRAGQAAVITKVWNHAGTAGTTPNALTYLGDAGKVLDVNAAPRMRTAMWEPTAHWSMAGPLSTVYNDNVNQDVLKEARLGRVYGFDNVTSQVVPSHTAGTVTGGTSAVNGTAQGVVTVASNVIPDGTVAATAGTGTLLVGDAVTIAGVYRVNPLTKANTGHLMQFVVATAATFATGAVNYILSPGLVTSGAYQNVSGAPSTNAAITHVYGTGGATFAQSLAYEKNAFSFASVPLALPDGAAYKARRRVEGIDIRIIKDYTILKDVDVCRVDCLFGIDATLPEFAVRIPGVGA